MEPERIARLRTTLEKRRGYSLNPDSDMTDALLDGLLVNTDRYGYAFCPCRLASGTYEQDRDLICPCNYRDQDVNEYGACYCGLYVSQEVVMGKKSVESIPERRGAPSSPLQLWRCQVCGYLCVRPHPPNVCPICGVSHDRFEAYNL
ncbi:MAG: ferredoxin-thioredoxin reductase catalytic domain-containing protein [candidate division FCPU426 bacterium]